MTESISSSALNRRDVTRDIFSASIGSVACCYTGQPFDTVKVRMQTNPLAYPSVLFTTRSIMTNEGIAAFWKGAVPTAMGMVAENAMAFGVNEALKRTFPDDAKEDPTKRPDLIRPFLMVGIHRIWLYVCMWCTFGLSLACSHSLISNVLMPYITKGAITGCCSATVLLPSEVVKAKTQVVVGNMESSSSDVYRKMMQRQGVRVRRYYLMHDVCHWTTLDRISQHSIWPHRMTNNAQPSKSLFVGFDAQIMRDAPFYAFFFGTYELNCYLFRTHIPSMPEELNYFMR